MILKKVEGRRNPRARHDSRLTVSGLLGHPSTPKPERRVETPGDPWGVPQPPGLSSPAYGTPPMANRWFLPLSSSQWGQTLPTTSVMFPVRIGLFVLGFNGPVNNEVMSIRSVNSGTVPRQV